MKFRLFKRGPAPLMIDRVITGRGSHDDEVSLTHLILRGVRGDTESAERFAQQADSHLIDSGAVVRFLVDNALFHRLAIQQQAARTDVEDLLEKEPALVRIALLHGMFRSAVAGGTERKLARIARMFDRLYDFGLLLASAIDATLEEWIDTAEERLKTAQQIIARLAPPDRSPKENRTVNRRVSRFKEWDRYPHQVLIVPGFTPDEGPPQGTIHPRLRGRLDQAMQDFRDFQAPFILVSGGNVWAKDPAYYEALDMRQVLVEMGAPKDRIIVEARARHSTTNLRNAGRYMLRHGMTHALITTSAEQDLYFSFAELSTFYTRCTLTLGYRVGDLADVPFDPTHSVFKPSQQVFTINYRDPLDP